MDKYSGCGNTFFIDLYKGSNPTKDEIINICKKEVDGLILVEQNPLFFHIYNRDGSIASMCGNGIRCFIQYCYDKSIITSPENTVLTLAGTYHTKIISLNPFNVMVEMVKPIYQYIDNKIHIDEKINIDDKDYRFSLVNTGVWHIVMYFTNDLEFKEAINHAEKIYNSEQFKGLFNINFVLLKDNVYLKTFEHGVNDFTKACGTGSVATFLILRKLNLINEDTLRIINDGGYLIISDKNNTITMTGESKKMS